MRFCLQKAFPNLFGCYDFFLGEGDVCLLASQVVLFGFRLAFLLFQRSPRYDNVSDGFGQHPESTKLRTIDF